MNEQEFNKDSMRHLAEMIGSVVIGRVANGEANRLSRIYGRDDITAIITKAHEDQSISAEVYSLLLDNTL